MEQVPSADLIEQWLGPFLVEADQIKGIYRNLDVDSVVFTYRTALATEQAFAEGLTRNLAASRWQRQTHTTAFIEYRRRFAKGETSPGRPDMPIFASREVIRLSFNSADRTVVVAYVQADASQDSDSFEDTGEGTWAEKAIWPKFDAFRHR
jgi:hypothetical protein